MIMDREEILAPIREKNIYEYGTLTENLADKLEKAGHVKVVAAGLSNNDFSHMLLYILKKEPEKVLEGLELLRDVLGAEKKLIYLPEEEQETGESLKKTLAETGDTTEVVYGIADMRFMRDNCICHLETLVHVSDAVHGKYQADTLVGVEASEQSGEFETSLEVVRVPFGITIASLLEKAGIQIKGIKAVRIGNRLYIGTEEVCKTELTPETALNDGVIRVYEKGCCMVDAAEKEILENRKHSCGKCTFCREGLNQLDIRLKEITAGKGEWADLEIMEQIGEAMRFSCCCTIGSMGAQFALETMKYFIREYEDHIKKKRCTEGTCPAFINMYISPERCIGCGRCIKICPYDYIEGLPGYIHMIEDVDCTKCGLCMNVCEEKTIIKTTGAVPRIPDRLTKAGRFKRY